MAPPISAASGKQEKQNGVYFSIKVKVKHFEMIQEKKNVHLQSDSIPTVP